MQQREPSIDGQDNGQTTRAPAGGVLDSIRPGHGRRPWLLLLLPILFAAAWLAGRMYFAPAATITPAAAPPPPQVSVAKPVVRDVIEWQEFTGRFVASDQVDLRSRIAGYIEAIHFKDGALVKKGDLLFTIDQRPAKFALEQATAAMKNAQSRIDFSVRDMARADQLSKTGVIAQTVSDQRKRDMQIAQSDMQAAQASAGRAKLDMEYAEIRAPFSGRIGRKNISIGNLVKIDDTLLTTLVAVDPIHFYFDIDERSALQAMRLQFPDAGGKPTAKPRDVMIALADETEAKHAGALDFVDNKLDETTGSLRMRAVVTNADGALQAGLFGRIRIPSAAPKRGILIPDEAIVSDQDRRIVYALTAEGTAKATTITPGPRIDGYRLVQGGLNGDEQIIVNGLMRVRPGAKVTAKMTTLPPVAGKPPAKE